MTKPREKTREELTAEIEESKKKIRQFENREKIIKQKLSVEERKARTHRLCKRGGFMESLVPELIAMPDEDAKAFLRLALTSEPAQEFLKKRAGDGTRSNPFGTKGALIHPCGRVRSAEGFISAQGTFPALRYGGFAATRGCTPCAASRLSLHTHKNSTPAPASVLFLRVLLSYPGGDTHSHLPL